MPSYAPLHWPHSTRWREKVSIDSGDMFYQDHQEDPWSRKTDPWSPSQFPWDNHSIIDDRNIPWQLPPQPNNNNHGHHTAAPWQIQQSNVSSPRQPLSENSFGSASSKPKISDLALDPNHLVLQSKYRPLRESPTPPKPKKKCSKTKNPFEEAQLKNTINVQSIYLNNMNQPSETRYELEKRLSNQLRPHGEIGGQFAANCNECDIKPCAKHCISTDPQLRLELKAAAKLAAKAASIDRRAFERYYEGSVLGPHASPPLGPQQASEDNQQGVCGGLGPLSLALALPGKLEGLLKLLAQSLHLVLAGFCSRFVNGDIFMKSLCALCYHLHSE